MSATEQDKLTQAIKTAIELETEGRECYLAASRDSRNEAGRKLLQSLAEEEEDHRRRFQSLYEAISKGHHWPAVPLRPATRRIRQNLVSICREIGVKVGAAAGELVMVNVAIDKEKKSYDFYHDLAGKAAFETEKEFYRTLAAEEWEHALALQDYAEYLTDPAGWFVKTEHPSLDGA
jgi:rubrerythrin